MKYVYDFVDTQAASDVAWSSEQKLLFVEVMVPSSALIVDAPPAVPVSFVNVVQLISEPET